MLKTGDPAPDFTVKDHTGRTVRLSDYRGKVRQRSFDDFYGYG